MSQEKSDGLATPSQAAALKAANEINNSEQVEKLGALAVQVSMYYNFLINYSGMEPYIALQLTQALQGTLMRGG